MIKMTISYRMINYISVYYKMKIYLMTRKNNTYMHTCA